MTAQKGMQIVGRARLCLSQHLVSPWRKTEWRNGAFKRIWRLFILTAFLALFGDVELPNQAQSRATAWRKFFLLYAPGANPSFFGRNFGFYGLCTFKWPGLYMYVQSYFQRFSLMS